MREGELTSLRRAAVRVVVRRARVWRRAACSCACFCVLVFSRVRFRFTHRARCNRTPIKRFPTVARKDLDLYQFYTEITQRGGLDKVSAVVAANRELLSINSNRIFFIYITIIALTPLARLVPAALDVPTGAARVPAGDRESLVDADRQCDATTEHVHERRLHFAAQLPEIPLLLRASVFSQLSFAQIMRRVVRF